LSHRSKSSNFSSKNKKGKGKKKLESLKPLVDPIEKEQKLVTKKKRESKKSIDFSHPQTQWADRLDKIERKLIEFEVLSNQIE